jgi:hypothetical protein
MRLIDMQALSEKRVLRDYEKIEGIFAKIGGTPPTLEEHKEFTPRSWEYLDHCEEAYKRERKTPEGGYTPFSTFLQIRLAEIEAGK